MDRLKLLDAGLRAFDSRLPDVAAPLCVVTRYRGSTCRLCLDACPADAVVTTPWLRVDPERCTSCGACAARCKTGALSFVPRARRVRERLREARQAGVRRVAFRCRVADGPVETEGAGEISEASEAVPCLGALAAGDLIAAAALGFSSVSLVDGGCPTCADRAAGLGVDEVVASVAEILTTLAPTFAVRRVAASSPAAGPAAAPVAVGGAAMSRRDLFAHLAHGLRRTAAEAAVPAKPRVTSLHEQGPPPVARAWLRSDLAALARRAGDRDTVLPRALPFGHVSVSPPCDGCGLCLRYCPHGALGEVDAGAAVTGDARRALPVVADDESCTGCGLCVESCPREALRLDPPALSVLTQPREGSTPPT